eukprot:Ihof_evm2s331 gene=Ihof_evmTU2s331
MAIKQEQRWKIAQIKDEIRLLERECIDLTQDIRDLNQINEDMILKPVDIKPVVNVDESVLLKGSKFVQMQIEVTDWTAEVEALTEGRDKVTPATGQLLEAMALQEACFWKGEAINRALVQQHLIEKLENDIKRQEQAIIVLEGMREDIIKAEGQLSVEFESIQTKQTLVAANRLQEAKGYRALGLSMIANIVDQHMNPTSPIYM